MPRSLTGVQPCRSTSRISSMMLSVIRPSVSCAGQTASRACESKQVIKRGCDDTEPARQRYECHACDQRFDDVTDTIFAGHHQPLKLLRNWLRPHRGISQERLPLSLGFFEFVHNVRKRGKALLPALIEVLVT